MKQQTHAEILHTNADDGVTPKEHRVYSLATHRVTLPDPFHMYRGGVLDRVEIAYEAWGKLNQDRSNVVLLFTGLSPNAHAASSRENPEPGWWEFMLGHAKPIDTERFFVVCINSLGSCYGSTGPGSINPHTGREYRLGFPELSIEDIASSANEALRALGINHVHTVVGASLGGMTALSYALHYPDSFGNLVSLCSGASTNPFAIAVRSLQREMIRSDPAWEQGNYPSYREPVEGMRLARKLGLITYRSAEEWNGRFARERLSDSEHHAPFDKEFQIESYLEANARKFSGKFDANSYLYLSRAMDWFDVAEHEERLIALASHGQGKRALVVGVETDILFPLRQQREVAELLAGCGMDVSFKALASVQGHDAFLVDKARFGPLVHEFLMA